jgi:hypothetical protein
MTKRMRLGLLKRRKNAGERYATLNGQGAGGRPRGPKAP